MKPNRKRKLIFLIRGDEIFDETINETTDQAFPENLHGDSYKNDKNPFGKTHKKDVLQ